MIDPKALVQFISGRAISLGVLLGFQVLAVRLLPPLEYARYALAIGLAALVQTITGLGLPRVAARFLSDVSLSVAARRRLAMALLGARALVSLALLGAIGGALLRLRPVEAELLWPGGAYALFSALQFDTDGMAQALGLQRASRRAVVGEPALRLMGALALAAGSGRSAQAMLWISAATAGLAAASLTAAALRALAGAGRDGGGALDWRAIRRVAVGGYGGTLSWLAFSPGVVRLIAGRVLPVEAFAGFAFVQTLAVSLQRYAPSFLLFPLAEPLLMTKGGRNPARLRAALSLLVMLDSVLIGAAIIGVSAAGGPIIRLLTHGRYGAAAAFLPWLLVGIIANAAHRSCEVAAIALGAAGALTRALGPTLLWLGLAVLAAPRWGVWPLLLCPLGDACTRLWLIERALARRSDGRGGRSLVDFTGLAGIGAGVAAISASAALAARLAGGALLASLGVGVAGALIFLALVVRRAPVSALQAALLAEGAPWLLPWLKAPRAQALRVRVLTPRGFGGVGGVDRLMDSLRPLMAGRADLKVHFLTTRGQRRWLSPLVTLCAMLRLAAVCAWGRCDLVHVNLGSDASCYRKLLLLAVPRRLGVAYVLHLHGSAFEAFWSAAPPRMQWRIDRLFQGAAQVIVLGEAWRALLARRLPAVRPVVLPNAAPPFAQDPPRARHPVQILFLGELGPRKGAAVLIEALGRLSPGQAWRAVIAGDGEAGPLRRRCAALGLAGRVRFIGWAGPQAVQALLAASHVLALPSFEETLPMAVIEAFAAGLAVIATPVGAVPDIVIHGETGLLIDAGDVEGLAAALHRLIETPALRHSLGCAAQARHRQSLSLGPYAERLRALWRQSLVAAEPGDSQHA